MAQESCRTKLSDGVLLWIWRSFLNKQVNAVWQRLEFCCCCPPSICMHMSFYQSQPEREVALQSHLLVLFLWSKHTFSWGLLTKGFPCVGHTDLLSLWSCICKYLWVYLVLRIEDGRDFIQPNISAWTFIFCFNWLSRYQTELFLFVLFVSRFVSAWKIWLMVCIPVI